MYYGSGYICVNDTYRLRVHTLGYTKVWGAYGLRNTWAHRLGYTRLEGAHRAKHTGWMHLHGSPVEEEDQKLEKVTHREAVVLLNAQNVGQRKWLLQVDARPALGGPGQEAEL